MDTIISKDGFISIEKEIGVEKMKIYRKVKEPDFWVISSWLGDVPVAVAPIVKRSDLIDEKAFLEAHLAKIPLTDAEKIAWSEANHPLYTHKVHLQERLTLVNEYLSNM